MDINYELYKVFYYVADTLSFSELQQLLFSSPLSASPLSTGKETGSGSFHPKHKKSSAHPGR